MTFTAAERWLVILALGFLNWLLCFLYSLGLLPLEIENEWMSRWTYALLVFFTTACCIWPYLKQSFVPSRRESIFVGIAWTCIALLFDYPARMLTESYSLQTYAVTLGPYMLLILCAAVAVGLIMKQLNVWHLSRMQRTARNRRWDR